MIENSSSSSSPASPVVSSSFSFSPAHLSMAAVLGLRFSLKRRSAADTQTRAPLLVVVVPGLRLRLRRERRQPPVA